MGVIKPLPQRDDLPERGERFFWWLRQSVLALGSFFFLLFGAYVLIASFYLNDPIYFIMSFFASTLMILISAAILAGPLVRMAKATFVKKKEDEGDKPDS